MSRCQSYIVEAVDQEVRSKCLPRKDSVINPLSYREGFWEELDNRKRFLSSARKNTGVLPLEIKVKETKALYKEPFRTQKTMDEMFNINYLKCSL